MFADENKKKSGGGVLCVLPDALIFLREPKKLRSKQTQVRTSAITCGDNVQLQRKNDLEQGLAFGLERIV